MRVIKRSTLASHWAKYPTAETSLKQWFTLTRVARWGNISDVRQVFPHADAVRVVSGNTVTIFNIAGNNFRLIVSIKYRWGIVYIRDFMTHAAYDNQLWKGRH